MKENWRYAFGILMCREIGDGAGAQTKKPKSNWLTIKIKDQKSFFLTSRHANRQTHIIFNEDAYICYVYIRKQTS